MYALITGASSGLGKDLANILAKEQYNLILVSRREALLKEIKVDLLKYGVDIIVIQKDLSVIDNCFELFEQIKEYDIKLFINNAGFGSLGYFYNSDLKKELNMVDLNIKTIQIFTKLYINHYENGLVVNIGSLAGILPTPIHANYSATKAYVNNFSRAVNYELKIQRKNVKVLTVSPGPIKTEFNTIANASSSKGMDSMRCAKAIYRGIKRKQELIIPGFSMKLIYFLSRFIPTKLLMKFSHKIQSSK